jgi:hypothetical protein
MMYPDGKIEYPTKSIDGIKATQLYRIFTARERTINQFCKTVNSHPLFFAVIIPTHSGRFKKLLIAETGNRLQKDYWYAKPERNPGKIEPPAAHGAEAGALHRR